MLRQKRGSFINFSTIAVALSIKGESVYAASKAGMIGFSKALALEVASRGITVNNIAPGFIKTPMTEPFLKDEEFKKQVLSMIPLGRLGEISDLMGPFVFLASDASSLMTGSSVLVDGGWTSR